MASFTLDQIRAAAEAKYGSLDIDLEPGFTVVLTNPLRLPKDRRDRLKALQGKFNAENAEGVDEVDEVAVLEDMVRTVVLSENAAGRLIAALDGDLTMLMETVKQYSELTQVGEASASAS